MQPDSRDARILPPLLTVYESVIIKQTTQSTKHNSRAVITRATEATWRLCVIVCTELKRVHATGLHAYINRYQLKQCMFYYFIISMETSLALTCAGALLVTPPHTHTHVLLSAKIVFR